MKDLHATYHRNSADKISEFEFYSTHPDSIQTFIDNSELRTFDRNTTLIWEPCAGRGNISRVLIDSNFRVISSDIVERDFPLTRLDFLNMTTKLIDNDVNVILTNPPFSDAVSFVKKAYSLLKPGGHVILFLRLTFLESKKRYELFKTMPIKYVYIHSSRQGCSQKGELEFDNAGACAYAWFVWEKDYIGDTVIKWLPPNS